MDESEEGDEGDEISEASDIGDRAVDEVPDAAEAGESREDDGTRVFVDDEGGCLVDDDTDVDEEYGKVPVVLFGTETLL